MSDVDTLLQAGFSSDEIKSYLGEAGFSSDEISSAMGTPASYDRGSAFAQSVGQGLSSNVFDEVEARIKTAQQSVGGAARDYLVNPLRDLFGYDSLPDTGKTYDENLADVRGQEAAYAVEHPYEQMVGQALGGIGAALIPFGAAAKGAQVAMKAPSLLARMLKGGSIAGAQGFGYGFGGGEGGIENRLEAGADVLGPSAALGGALPVVGAGAKTIYNALLGPQTRRGAERIATKVINETCLLYTSDAADE